MGSGKSGASIAITNGYKNKQDRYLTCPRPFEINYLQEIEKFGESLFKPNLNWEFFNFDTVNTFSMYKWISEEIISKLPQFNDLGVTFEQDVYERYISYKTTGQGSDLDKNVGSYIFNIETAIQNNLFMHIEELGISYDLLEKITTSRGGSDGIWLLNNNFSVGDVIQNKLSKDIFKVIGISHRTIQLRKLSIDQIGGAKCSMCGALGVTKRTCPLNDLARNQDFEGHLEATKILAENTAQKASLAAQNVIRDLETMSFPTITTSLKEGPIDSGTIQMPSDIDIPLDKVDEFLHYTTQINFTGDDKLSICKQIKAFFCF